MTTTTIKDHLIDDHLFGKIENNQTSSIKIFRPWDCAINNNENTISTAATKSSSSIKQHLKENSLNIDNLTKLNNSLKSNQSTTKFPNDYLTEMFNTSCTMNQNSLNAMETLYSHFYRDYFTNRKNLPIKIENGNNLTNELSLLNTFTSKMNLSKIVNDCTINTINSVNNNLTSSSSNRFITTGTTNNNSKLITNDTLLINQLPINNNSLIKSDPNKIQNNDKNQQKKPRPKRFRCPHCDICFSNNGQLKGHVRTHTGERPFVCDNPACGKTFTRNEELTRHKRIHTGLRPYDCHICQKKFGRKDHLKKHQRTHEKRKMALAKNISPSSNIQLTNSLCLNTPFNTNKNKFSINRTLTTRISNDKQNKLDLKSKKVDFSIKTNSLSSLNSTNSTENLVNSNLQNATKSNLLYNAKQFTVANNLPTTINSKFKTIDNQLITSNTNNILPLSSTLSSTISNNFLPSNHSLPTMLGKTNSINSLINSNQSFSNQFNNQVSNHSISSPTSSECSFNSNSPVITSLSASSPSSSSLPINTLPFSNSLYFNTLMLPFIQ